MRPSASSNHKKIAGIREPLVITKDGDSPDIDAAQDLRRSTGSRLMKQKQRRKVFTSQPSPEMERKGVVVELGP